MRSTTFFCLLTSLILACSAQTQKLPRLSAAIPRPTADPSAIIDQEILDLYFCPKAIDPQPWWSASDTPYASLMAAPLWQTQRSDERYQVAYWGFSETPRLALFRRDGRRCSVKYIYSASGKLRSTERELSKSEWARIRQLIGRGEFWNLSTSDRTNSDVVYDGAWYSLEAQCGTSYHAVSRVAGDSPCFEQCCRELLQMASYDS